MINLYDLPFEIICKIYFIKNKELSNLYKSNYLNTINELKQLHLKHYYTFFRGKKILTNISKNIVWFELQII